jgi:branched-chain amino acid aminotransferase
MVPDSAAKIHLLNHSLHYGSGVFEGIRCYDTEKGPAVFRLKDHVRRLFHSAGVMGMRVPYRQNEIIKAIKRVVKMNKLRECYIRPIIFYGAKMGLSPEGAPLHVAIAAWPWGKYLTKDSVSVGISSFARLHHKSSVMTAKISGHYSNSIIASIEAKRRGFDEALFLDDAGYVAEGPGENIFFVKGKTLFTPKLGKILPGITRASIMAIARRLGYKVVETDVNPKKLKKYDEAFFVGTAAEVNAIGKINKTVFGRGHEGPATKRLREAYQKAIHGQDRRFAGWLDHA